MALKKMISKYADEREKKQKMYVETAKSIDKAYLVYCLAFD